MKRAVARTRGPALGLTLTGLALSGVLALGAPSVAAATADQPTVAASQAAATPDQASATPDQASAAPDPASAAPDPPTARTTLIAYVRKHQVRTIDPDRPQQKVVLTDSGVSYAPTWSPDGTTVAYVHESSGGVRDLWVMAADGSGKTALTTSGGVSTGGASWSPDGTELAFGGPCIETEDDPDLCEPFGAGMVLDTVSASGGEPVTVNGADAGPVPGAMTVFDRVSWAASGDHIAFTSNSYPSAGDQYVLVYLPSTGDVELVDMINYGGIYGTLAYPTFSQDGQLLAYDAYVDEMGEVAHEGIQLCDYADKSCGGFRDVARDSWATFAPESPPYSGMVALVRDKHRDRIVIALPDGSDRSFLTYGAQPSWQPVLD